MEKLAWIGKIIEIAPIVGADKIVSAKVICGKGGIWQGIVQKDQFKVNDTCEVYLQDSILPANQERFAFMSKYHYRVRMVRFKGTPSEALIMLQTITGNVGDDVSLLANVLRYEKQIPAQLAGTVEGLFPNFVPKTDEPNFQSIPELVEAIKGKQFYSSVKVDGTSSNFYKTNDKFGVCSRNLQLKKDDNNIYWKIATKYKLEEVLPVGFAVQGEVIGPGIQKNPLGLKEIDIQFFNVWSIEERRYLNAEEFVAFCKKLNLPIVQIIEWDKPFNFKDSEEIRVYAEGLYPNGRQREGVVFRPMIEERVGGDRLSFKAINLKYKD